VGTLGEVSAIAADFSKRRLIHFNDSALLFDEGHQPRFGIQTEVRAVSLKMTKKNSKLNSMVRVRQRTIPTERPPLVGEVIANLC
jgi:hypothetical protein